MKIEYAQHFCFRLKLPRKKNSVGTYKVHVSRSLYGGDFFVFRSPYSHALIIILYVILQVFINANFTPCPYPYPYMYPYGVKSYILLSLSLVVAAASTNESTMFETFGTMTVRMMTLLYDDATIY